MLRKAEIAAASRPAVPGAKPAPKKPPLSLGDLPKECMTVLSAGGGMPTIAPDGTVPAALKAEAGKDAGPPAPHLDPEALAALKASMSKSKPGAKAAPTAKPANASASTAPPAQAASTAGPVAPAAQPASTVGPASPSDSVPLPDRKPQ
jgi:hypothetical protein